MNVYFNANPNQSWSSAASFSAGQLVATFESTTGTETGTGGVALVTQSYILVSSSDFTFQGQTYNFARLVPHGFTSIALSSDVAIPNTPPSPFPRITTAAGSGIAVGGPLSALPWWF